MNKKGFTLVELLAVIAILAILVILALPAVLRMFEQARVDSFNNEINSLIKTAEQQFLLDSMSNLVGNIAYTNAGTTVEGVNTVKELNLTGNSKFKYYVLVSNEGKILNIRATNGSYSYARKADDVEHPIVLGNIDIRNDNDVELESDITSTLLPTSEMTYLPPEPTDVSCFTYTISDNEVTIKGYKTTCTKDVVIPSTIEDTPVTIISKYAFSSKQLTSVIIPDGVTTIGEYAFIGNALSSVKIPNSVIIIDNWAFKNNQLARVTIPPLVTKIGISAFANNKLRSVTIPNGVTEIDAWAFSENKLSSVTIPNSVTSIGNGAFNTNLLPDGQAIIYKRTDNNNDGIAEIDYTTIIGYGGANRAPTVPNGVTTIETYAFYNDQLTSIILPDSLQTIGTYAFQNNLLTSVTIPDSVISMDAHAFAFNQLATITIPNGLTALANGVFKGNQLTSITIPNNISSIDHYAFESNQLTSVTIKGKTSSSDFTTYGSGIWGWASDVTCTKNNTSNVENGCITWGAQ